MIIDAHTHFTTAPAQLQAYRGQQITNLAKPVRAKLIISDEEVARAARRQAELETLITNNISYEIIPGVTAASGAAAYAGIPLTARGFASSVRFLTYTHPELVDEKQIRELASTDDTLVFYMASKHLLQLVTRLLKNEISEEKWVAVVEQATTPGQKVFSYPVKEFLSGTRERRFRSPSIIIIGKVAKLNQQFNWFNASKVDENFFPTVQTDFLNTAKVA